MKHLNISFTSLFFFFTFSPDKCPATRVLASQLNPSGTVINHLLLGRKPHGSTSTSVLPGSQPTPVSQSQGSPGRHRCGTLPSSSRASPGSSRGGAGSPWRTHVRVHRRNVARARAQLGFGDSEEQDDEEGGGSEGVDMKMEENKEQKTRSDSFVPHSPDPSHTGSVCEEAPQVLDETRAAEVSEVVVQLDSLDLEDKSNLTSTKNTAADTRPSLPVSQPVPQVPLLPPPPSSSRHKESDSSGSERTSASDRHCPTNASTPTHHSSSIPSSSASSPSPSLSPVPAPASLEPYRSSSSTPPTTPTQPTTSFLLSSPSANDLSSLPSSSSSSSFYKTSSRSIPSLSSTSSLSRSHVSSSPSTPAFPSSSCTAKQQVYSPFPSVKPPRKSAAARNLGLYGPTSRTPTVHFPQLNRNLNRSSGAGTTGRR